tara:strand:- start:358 stop:657 length:300 start_codon:yes stop_codon:yes gene_type:complete
MFYFLRHFALSLFSQKINEGAQIGKQQMRVCIINVRMYYFIAVEALYQTREQYLDCFLDANLLPFPGQISQKLPLSGIRPQLGVSHPCFMHDFNFINQI